MDNPQDFGDYGYCNYKDGSSKFIKNIFLGPEKFAYF